MNLYHKYKMDLTMDRNALAKSRIESKEKFGLRIEETRKIFSLANREEQALICLASDLGLRVSDFLSIKKSDIETA